MVVEVVRTYSGAAVGNSARRACGRDDQVKRSNLTLVWTLKMSLSTSADESSMQSLRETARLVSERERAPFLWNTHGLFLTARSEGEPLLLMELAEWAMLNVSPDLVGFEIVKQRTAPLHRTGEWQGHGRN